MNKCEWAWHTDTCCDFDENTNIVLKLDVESSEYDILESLIKRKIIFKLNKIYCEFHSIYMNQNLKNEYEVREKNILNFVKENNIDLELWE